MQTRKNKKSQLFWLLNIFLLPVILSFVVFHYHNHFHLKTTNHGTLLNPPLDIQYLFASDKSGKKLWRIVYVHPKACDQNCQWLNHQLLQVQKALGKDSERVAVLEIDGDSKAFNKVNTGLEKNKIYLIDPIGNGFMMYSDRADPMDVLKDLKKVLGVSQIG